MTEEQSNRIAALASDAHDKRRRYEVLGMFNTVGLTPEEARKQSIEYEIARAEWAESVALLQSAREEMFPVLRN